MEYILTSPQFFVIVLSLLICAVTSGTTVTASGYDDVKDSANRTERGGIEDMTRLLSTLLDRYRPDVLPRVNNSYPIEVKVGLGVNSLISLDTRNQMISIRGYLRSIWTDPLLQWEPEDYGNITYVVLSSKAVWMPDLTLANSLQDIFLNTDGSSINVVVDYRGTVDWQPPIVSDFSCEIDVAKYPLDVNICPIFVCAWMHDISALNLSLMEQHTVRDKKATNGQFLMDVGLPVAESLLYDGKSYGTVTFHLKFSRRPEYTLMSMVFPMVVIGLLSPLSFLIPPDSGEKVGVSLNVLLSTTVCVGLVRGDLPDRSDKLSSVAVYAVSILVSAFVSVLGNIIVLLVHLYKSSPGQDTGTAKVACDPDEDTKVNEEQKIVGPQTLPDTPIYSGIKVRDQQSLSLGWKLNWLFFGVVTLSNCVSVCIVLNMMIF